jgi:hypothetical protein
MPKPWPPHVLLADDPTTLDGIRKPEYTMAIWPRTLGDAVSADILRLPVSAYPNVRLITAHPERDIFSAFAAAANGARTQTPLALAADVAMLANMYRKVMRVEEILVRIERITEARRRLLHTDEVQLRLLCTYRGLTTRWLADDDACREGIGKSNAAICRKPSAIRRLVNGQVALIKGELWPGNAGRGLVHGEPYVCRPSHHRMAVVIDDARYAPEYRRK